LLDARGRGLGHPPEVASTLSHLLLVPHLLDRNHLVVLEGRYHPDNIYLSLTSYYRPLNPVKLGPIIIQGIFLKRQQEVSETFARINCNELLGTDKMWEAILTGPNKKNFQLMLRAHSIVFTEKLIGGLKPLALAAMGNDQFQLMKEDIAMNVIAKLPNLIGCSYDYTTEALDLENTIRTRMQALSPRDFEGVLHPAFEEDEMTLIMVGGVLGMLVGVIQIFIFMFS
jgi:uncharacterized membrane protein YheB (UPF0754 family)